ncbi:hypothetical protein KIN20_024538 [Parelaphostrongylus tenuis]|uniref:Uncharacterized protein n=1 Tax=Parelaphostrongylus tenuis TaxID=148309 RepID=A0AAD5QTQ2_PARTN|nr:hypothetical protein KIN20_024538 [Parelaphostrongylus tenuis]
MHGLPHRGEEQCDNLSAEQFQKEFKRLPEPDMRMCTTWLEPQNIQKNRYNSKYHFVRVTSTEIQIFPASIPPEFQSRFVVKKLNPVIYMPIGSSIQHSEANILSRRNVNVVTRYGQLNVVLMDRKFEDEVITSTLEIRYQQESHTITHHQWENWSDFKAPGDNILVGLLQKVRGRSTVVVHCSAGIGRSGTFMALEMCLQDLANDSKNERTAVSELHKTGMEEASMVKIVVVKTTNTYRAVKRFKEIRGLQNQRDSLHNLEVTLQVVAHLRKYRALAVQTFEQYLSIYRTILLLGERHGTIRKAEVQRFHDIYQQHVRS